MSFHLFNAAATSSILMQSAGPSLTPADILRCHSFSSFISFSMYALHKSLIPFLSTINLPHTPFRQFDPVYHLLCYSKNFTLIVGITEITYTFFCFFPFAKEITLFAFCLLFLYSFRVSVDFSSFPISILFLLYPYCFSNILIPPACFLMTAWTF